MKYQDVGQGLRLNDYALVLQAVMASQGVSLGWEQVTRHLIDVGLLAQVGPWAWDSGKGFYLVWSQNSDLSDDAKAVRDWIVKTSAV